MLDPITQQSEKIKYHQTSAALKDNSNISESRVSKASSGYNDHKIHFMNIFKVKSLGLVKAS